MRKISLRDLMSPKKIEIEEEADSVFYGKFVAEPLERGFGITIGNGLRRVLLSSLQGAAITSVLVDGVMHEFSTIPGVVEDVTEIVLNLKEVILRLEDKDSAIVRIEASGVGVVKAGMISGDPSVVVINPEAHIATLAEGGSLSLTLEVKLGRGYSPAERNRTESAPMGTIFIDALFSPVRRVNHSVTNARVGQRTDYDRLVFEVWTNGSVDARSAVAQAAHILTDQLKVFVGDDLVLAEEEHRIDEPRAKFNDNLFRRIEEIELSVRSANCLENADIKYIGELVQKSEAEMLRTKNFGRKSLNEIKEILGEMGLSLGMRLEEFPTRRELEGMRESNEH
jgi:DNA-directed RNA polymerase subunit alpha